MIRLLRFAPALAMLFLLMTCTEAVEPTFRFKDGFLLVEGRIADTPGFSEVRISRNQVLFDNSVLLPVIGAQVSSVSNSGEEVICPAFDLLVDVEDPADEENFYQYNFSYFEEIFVCASCVRARWRNGECIEGPDTRFVTRWDYLCDARCWISTQAAGRNVMSDAFGNGRRLENILAGRLDYERPGGVLFVLNQYNTSRASFEFNSVIETLTEGTGGLNAPLPSALIGTPKAPCTGGSRSRDMPMGWPR